MNDTPPQFDVFLAHNSLDKPEVIAIAEKLKSHNLKPWLDKEQIFPGDNIHEVVFQGISQSKVGAFFISQNGLGTFQENLELGAIIQFFLKKRKEQGFRVIPILLPGIHDIPENFFYLRQWAWIKFTSLDDQAALEDLVRGIRGRGAEFKAPPVIPTPQTPIIIQPPPTPPKLTQPDDDLSSEKGVDYTKLRDLLAAGNWKDADDETFLVMLQAVGRKKNDWIRDKELLNFPCTDLRTIDRLWVKHSKGRFGFSVQKEIYLSVGGKPDGKYYEEAWVKFGDRVGWRVESKWNYYSNVAFNISAPRGHLPYISFNTNQIVLPLIEGAMGTSGTLYSLLLKAMQASRLPAFDLPQGISSLASRLAKCNI